MAEEQSTLPYCLSSPRPRYLVATAHISQLCDISLLHSANSIFSIFHSPKLRLSHQDTCITCSLWDEYTPILTPYSLLLCQVLMCRPWSMRDTLVSSCCANMLSRPLSQELCTPFLWLEQYSCHDLHELINSDLIAQEDSSRAALFWTTYYPFPK